MNLCISHVCSLKKPLKRPTQNFNSIKRKILHFRVQELEELLAFLNLNGGGAKAVLRERILKYLKKEIELNVLLDEKLEAKIEELNDLSVYLDRLCKIPIRKKGVQFVGPLYDTQVFPMFSELRQLVYGQRFKMTNGQQSFCFTLTAYLVHKILTGKKADGTYRFEVQLNIWNCTTTENWNDIYLCVEVNGKPIDVVHPSPHLIYLTRHCHLKQLVKNTIIISSSRPATLQDYAFCICVVKRWYPSEIVESNPVKEGSDTELLISKKLDSKSNRRLKMYLTCPETKSIMKYPCRSVLCTHPEVFDLKTFLNDKQYYQQWKCPVCMKIITYEDIVMDMFLKNYLDEGVFTFLFYKRRKNDTLSDVDDKEIQCVKEVITLQD